MRALRVLWQWLNALSGETRLQARMQAHAGHGDAPETQVKAALRELFEGINRCC